LTEKNWWQEKCCAAGGTPASVQEVSEKNVWACVSMVVTAISKGQLISKGIFGILNSSKKRTINLTIMIPQVDLFPFVFWKNLKIPKIHFEIY
jgi:hypothetical protein